MEKIKLKHLLQKWWWLFTALVLILIRTPWIVNRTIPFNFDHGKDSLAVLHMLLTGSLKFVGPWTSIPGLYFGPSWYYLLAPWYLLGGFDPLWGMIAMLILHVLLILFVGKKFGWLTAVIVATAPTWQTISGSAWNPFPMPAISFLILLSLEEIRQHQRLELKGRQLGWWFLLGLSASFGFHFSTAFAIFYPVIIGITLWFKQIKVVFLQLLLLGIGFTLPFLPQLAFELKHNFIESRAIISYLTTGDSPSTVKPTLQQVIAQTYAELKLGVLPDIWLNNTSATHLISFFSLSVIVFAILYAKYTQQTWGRWWFELLVWIVIPTVLLSKLHYNLWYVLGMLPVAVLFVADKLSRLPRMLLILYVALLLVTPLSMIARFYLQDKPILLASRQFLPVKEQVIRVIREKANGLPFAVYHYVPDIYDFTYQYLYLSQAKQGQALPLEFAYQPQVAPYVVEKAEILSALNVVSNNQAPALLFYVVEKPENQEFLAQWWGMQRYETIIEVVEISQELTLYVALPKTN